MRRAVSLARCADDEWLGKRPPAPVSAAHRFARPHLGPDLVEQLQHVDPMLYARIRAPQPAHAASALTPNGARWVRVQKIHLARVVRHWPHLGLAHVYGNLQVLARRLDAEVPFLEVREHVEMLA